MAERKAPILITPLLFGHKESWFPAITVLSQACQLAVGPAVMMALLFLQTLKAKLTGTQSSALYSHIVKFLAKSEARDKVGRIVQYGCRFLQGSLVHMPATLPLQAWKPAIAEVQTTLAWARRTHRWGKEMPHVPALAEALFCKGDLLEAGQRGVLIMFLIQDHIYWLLKVGLLKFKAYTPIEWHRRNLRFIILSHVLNFTLCLRSIRRIQAKQIQGGKQCTESREEVAKAEQEIYDNKKMMFRYVLTTIQMSHVSRLVNLDDWYIGLMGMVSSYIDASKQW
eukprot:TRINITY_DN10039_c0_g1_i3.p1 TRINITY_DN10039_c0_g1~~TRINITY_DN10039_c0_g1_i3.p1  ORF type:complete len:282 (+),score=29.98 TRINITY_DN10039_c0_g1_i3:91-936(+)